MITPDQKARRGEMLLQGQKLQCSTSNLIRFPRSYPRPPWTLSRIVAHYQRTVRGCRGCYGPILPLSRSDWLCSDCRRWN